MDGQLGSWDSETVRQWALFSEAVAQWDNEAEQGGGTGGSGPVCDRAGRP